MLTFDTGIIGRSRVEGCQKGGFLKRQLSHIPQASRGVHQDTYVASIARVKIK